ncbi:MAG TPA: hypothetical protein VKR83_04560 [Ktedonobacteraceae bacterium]|nr:hypothetical protein [Ktedonobacteraceae bacterium]
MQRATRHTVLLVEANPSLRRIIALGLQHRGLRVVEASSPASFPTFPALLPDLLVLDVDGEAGNSHTLLAQAQAHPALANIPVVALAWEKLIPIDSPDVEGQFIAPPLNCLTKPFDARALHAAIEQILLNSEVGDQLIAPAQSQENYLAARSATPAPSIFPLLTAIGLLLAVIGLMLQITVTAVGLLVVLAALLCWTLGAKPVMSC